MNETLSSTLPRPGALPGAAGTEAVPEAAPGRASPAAPARGGVGLFLRRWAAHPLRMGSVVPSSPALCRRVVRHAWPEPGRAVLELGAGTGVMARALLGAGLGPERLAVVEIDPDLCAHLRATLPGVTVVEGDARALPSLLPTRFRGRIGSVVCGIPLVLLPPPEQRRFIDAMVAVAPGRGFLHYSYCITSPLPARRHGLSAVRRAWTPLNVPPASVWFYRPDGAESRTGAVREAA
ncbi:methyltransferase domain-containing protein [Roseomonas sp. NAR14]|uniref:Methyltransferase domain-containing protein n=1 Tax=Roseomonas acroporae TaxID=2937791 RepID=A0A9X1YCJ0_9PROT|nr:methyltransferase domain-containing protein [Roseomonas acroporae]MCK8786515.1 methyltransferase domain-containing protein [Roseomonas acroporae]